MRHSRRAVCRFCLAYASALLASVGCGRFGFESHDAAPDAPPPILHVMSAGGFDSCLVEPSGEVWCWGAGERGELGDGDLSVHQSSSPQRVPVPPVVGVDVNDGGAVAWRADGTMVGWGPNFEGMLGIDTGAQASPIALPGITDAIEATHDLDATCVLRAGGTVACAGFSYQLGDGSTASRPSFGEVPGLSEVVALTSGDDHMCALLRDGAVTCWGDNSVGQLGDGTTITANRPVAGPPGPYKEVAAGDRYTCGLRPAGTVDCWGGNELGQLGDGTVTQRPTAAPVQGLDQVIAIAAAASTGCALRATSELVCWGSNAYGELAVPSTVMFRGTPGSPILSDVVAIGARTSIHVCGLTRDGAVWCWGDDAYGQVGDPSGGQVYSPIRVLGLPSL